jgi:serine/threonine protein kinase/tetratricopeptide (TPR) repeat protein
MGDRPNLVASRDEKDCHAVSIHPWQQVEELLHQALALAPEERSRFLDQACASSETLRAELESLLLVGAEMSDDYLKSPVSGELERNIEQFYSAGALSAGELFAQRFELVRKLGEGGMGQVWLAEQISPLRRQVALKLVKAGMYDEAVVQRFQSERQSLAMMDHPAIAKVFDAGTTTQGQPYLVMEYVPGPPITDYCDQHQLNISDRLELFIQACEGVQHAHQKAIIHRDLKPSNILVIEVDGKPMPRIIDFGLAKTTAAQLTDESQFTQLGQFIGTPGYMSPEQVNRRGPDIDTRTDVYSLGVILYVLLTGLQPFETKRREKPSLEEWLRQLREDQPPNPSTKVSSDKDTSIATADARNTEPKKLISQLRGDLDWITMRALERDRDRRYGTASELAADLRRFLNHEPVIARPASATYRLRKYVRRHRVAMGVGAGLLLVLAVFSFVQALQLRETSRERDHAKQERDRANQERDRATRIADFMSGMFKVPDPSEARGNSVTAREILDRAANDIGTGLARDPEVQSQMMHEMASTYNNLGLQARAQTLAQRALDARLSLHGPNDPKTLESATQLGLIMHMEGHDTEAEALDRRALADERRVLGSDDPLTLETADDLATVLNTLGRYPEAEKLAREVVDSSARRLGPENALTLRANNHLGSILFYAGHAVDAESVLRPALEVERRVWGPDHPETMKAMTMLAICLHHQNRFAEAEPLYREVLTNSERVLGAEHQSTAVAMANLANMFADEDHLPQAEKLFGEALAILSRTFGPDHPRTLIGELNLSRVLRSEGHLQEAEQLQRQTLATELRAHGPEYPDTFLSQSELAKTLFDERHYAEAEKLARETFDIQLRTLGPRHRDVLDTLQRLGMAMALNHHYGAAKLLFIDVIDKARSSEGSGNRWYVWYAFACAAVAANHPDEAIHYLQEASNQGLKDADGLATDDDLKNLRSYPQFQQFLAEMKRPTSSAQAR